MPTNVLIAGKLVLVRGIVHKKAVFRPDDVVEHRDWKIRSGYARLPRTDCHRITAGRGFRDYLILITSRKDQQTSLSPRVLNCCTHEGVDQFLQDDLTRYGL
jgi:hypothetical protein